MKTYLVTGGAGFIGSNYIQYMLEKHDNINIINVDSLTYAGNLRNLECVEGNKNYLFIKEDICNVEAIEGLFKSKNIDYVINFAAESHVDRSIKDSESFIKTNIFGTMTLLNAANAGWSSDSGFKPGKKFIQISTDEVYGTLGDTGYFTEDTPLNARSPYSASKASADLIVRSYFYTHGLPINITRCSNNYGPYQFPEKLIPLMINNALNGQDLPVYGDGKNIRDWIYVLDHVKAIDLVTQKGRIGEIYNIGAYQEKENIEVVYAIIKSLNELLLNNDNRKQHINHNLVKYIADRKGHDRRYAVDSTKINQDLGFNPDLQFDEGIQKTVKWYLDNYDWLWNVTSGDYRAYYSQMYGV